MHISYQSSNQPIDRTARSIQLTTDAIIVDGEKMPPPLARITIDGVATLTTIGQLYDNEGGSGEMMSHQATINSPSPHLAIHRAHLNRADGTAIPYGWEAYIGGFKISTRHTWLIA